MVKFNSTIFRTIKDDATGATTSIRLFGKTFTELKNTISSIKTNGLFKSYVINDSDVKCIEKYNTLIEGGTPHLEAMEQATKGASDSTAKMIKNANGNTIALNQMTLGAKAASVALNVLSTAANMLVMYAITKLITAWSDYKEKLHDIANENAEQAEKSAEYVDNLLDLQNQLKEGTKNSDELTNAFKEQLKAMGYTEEKIDDLIVKYGGLSGAISEATREALENAKTDAYTDLASASKALEIDSTGGLTKDILITDFGTGIKELDAQINEILSKVATKTAEQGQAWITKDDSAEGLYAYYNALQEVSKLIQETASKTNNQDLLNLGNAFDTTTYGEVTEAIDKLKESAELYGDAINRLHSADAQLELSDYLKTNDIDSQETFDSYIDGIKNSTEYSEAYKQVLISVANDAFPQFSSSAKDASDSASNFANKIDVSLDSYQKASEGISSLATAYKELSDSEYISLEAISKIKEAVGDSFSDWDAYEKKLLTVKKGSDEFDKVLGDLTYAILENKLGVDGLVNADEDYVANLLKENGVLNANKVAKEMIAVATAKSKINMEDETDVIIDNVEEMYRSGAATKLATGEMLRLIAAEKIFNNEDLSMAGKVDDLETLAKAFGITTASAETAKKSIENVNKVRQNVLDGINGAKDLVKAKKQAENDFKTYTKDILGNIDVEFGKLTDINYGGNDKKKKDEKTPETFDWIETKLSRLQRKITNLGNAVSDTFKKWSTRNSSLKDEIKEITKLLEVQEKATKKYKKKADSVKLSSSYKKKVREGAIDIDTIKDDDLKEKIKKYQEYYNKYLESLDKEAEAKSKLNEKYRQQFDNIAGEYENKIERWSNYIANLEKQVELSEAKGNQISGSSYNDIITQQKKLVNLEKSEYDDLLKKFNDGVKNGTLEKESEEWYKLKSEISQVKQSWYDAQIALEDYLQAQREADWDIFDNKQQKKTDFISDNDFLLGLLGYEDMYDDNGNITKYGSSANALHTINYDTYIQQAKDYATELVKLDKQYANDKNDTYYLERRKELLDAQQEAIDGAKNERQAMIDLAKEGYDALINSMQKVIDKRKEALNEIKSLYEYEKQISKQTDEISVIQKQLIAYQGDDSSESQSTIQQLQKSLRDAEENLQKTQYDKYIQDQEQLYDKLMEDTQTWVDELFENESALLKNIADVTAESGSLISETIKALASSMGYSISTDLTSTLNSKGYASGIKNIPYDQMNWIHSDELLYRASDGGLLMPLGSGDKVFTKEMSDRLWDIAQIGFKPIMPSMPSIAPMQNNNDIHVSIGDIQMYGVNDPQEFAKQIKEAYSNNTGNLRKMIQSDMFSTNSLGHRRYL